MRPTPLFCEHPSEEQLGTIESGGERGMYQRRVVLYARRGSLRCWRAKRILARGGYHFEVVEAAEDSPSGYTSGSRTGAPNGRCCRTSSSTSVRYAAWPRSGPWVARAPSNTWYAASYRFVAWRRS
jgi:hypothetical protein